MLSEEWKKKFINNPYKGKYLSVIGDSINAYTVYGTPWDNSYIEPIPSTYTGKVLELEKKRQEYDISRFHPYEHDGNYYKREDDGTVKYKKWYDSEGNLTADWPVPGINRHSYFCISTEEMQNNLKLILGCDYAQFEDYFQEVFNNYHTRMDIIHTILSNTEIQQAGEGVFGRVKRALQGFDPMTDDYKDYSNAESGIVRNGAEKMWWYQLCELTGMKPLRIYGWGGRCVTGIQQYKGGYNIYARRFNGIGVYKPNFNNNNGFSTDSNGKPSLPAKNLTERVKLKGINNSVFETVKEGDKIGQVPFPYKKPLYDIRELKKLGVWENGSLATPPDVIMIQCFGNDLTNNGGASYSNGGYKGFNMLGTYDGSTSLKDGLEAFYGVDEDGDKTIIFGEHIDEIYILDRTVGGDSVEYVKDGQTIDNDTLGKYDLYGDKSVERCPMRNSFNYGEDHIDRTDESKGVLYKNGKRYITLERALDEGNPPYYNKQNTIDGKANDKSRIWLYEDKRRRYLCDFSLAAALTIARLQYLYPDAQIYWFVMSPVSSIKSQADKIMTRYNRAIGKIKSTDWIYFTDGEAPAMPRRLVYDYGQRLKQICHAFGVTPIGTNTPTSGRYALGNVDTWVRYNYDNTDIDAYSNYSKYYNKPIFGSHLNEEGDMNKALTAAKALLCDKVAFSNTEINRKQVKLLFIGNQDIFNASRWVWKILQHAGYKATVGIFNWYNGSLENYYNSWANSILADEPFIFNEDSDKNSYYAEFTDEKPDLIYSLNFEEVIAKGWDICILQPRKPEYGKLITHSWYDADKKTNTGNPSTISEYKYLSELKNKISTLNENCKFGLMSPWLLDPHYSNTTGISDLLGTTKWQEFKNNVLEESTNNWDIYLKNHTPEFRRMRVETRKKAYDNYYIINKNNLDFINSSIEEAPVGSSIDENLTIFDFIIDCATLYSKINNVSNEKQEGEDSLNPSYRTLKKNVGGQLLETYNTLSTKSWFEEHPDILLEPTEDNIDNTDPDNLIDNYILNIIGSDSFSRSYMVTKEELEIIKQEASNYSNRYYSDEENSENSGEDDAPDTPSTDDSDVIDEDEEGGDSSAQKETTSTPTIMLPLTRNGYNLSFYTAQFLFSYLIAAQCIGYFNLLKEDPLYDIYGTDYDTLDNKTNLLDLAACEANVNPEEDYDISSLEKVDFNEDGKLTSDETRVLLRYIKEKFMEVINKDIQWYPNKYDAWFTNEQYQDVALQATKENAEAIKNIVSKTMSDLFEIELDKARDTVGGE